jgi:glycosyltransferase involved in cell wall biosynthesis
VHILNPLFLNTCSVAGLGIPIVCDWDELSSAREKRVARWPATLVVEKIARRLASLNVVASRCLQQLFQSRFGIDSLYLPYAAYLPDRPTGPNPFAKPTAVYLGNLVPDFDHDIVIDAWELLKRRGVALDLAIMGGGELFESVRSDVAKRGLKNVHVEGYMTGQPMWDRLRYAHVLLFPIRDNTGNRSRCPSKTFAYMQAGRPIIANRVGEVAEALGDLAEYVEATPEAFADAVARVADRHLPDVAYPLHLHTWSDRAARLLAALRDCGIVSQAVPVCG